jgi:hypothetical protein
MPVGHDADSPDAWGRSYTRGALSSGKKVSDIDIYLFVVKGRIMIMNATPLHGQDDQPRKKSLMAPIVQGLISGGIVCGVLIALVVVLRYGTEGHSFPTRLVSRRHSPLA